MGGPRIAIEARSPVRNGVAIAELPPRSGLEEGEWQALGESGESYPAQVTSLADGSALVGVYVRELAKGESLQLALRRTEGGGAGRGIDVLDQAENGRVVVNYSGFMQTMYHYGLENFKPRFYPITAPCAHLGPIDSEDTLYPKSITEDSPPDHIWHRSLWYACGDLNGADFYLENGGEGRIVHERFSDVFSGPVFGGFREELTWVAPGGKRLLDDERRFVHYRVKGALRLFDIEARFTALEEPVTFGQTNENALPLIRVADIIDEWDGGRITLADGTTGGKDAFGKRAEWADCSGPLVRKPGRESLWFGIAMLDHPANRNHPNAWFARSYGPLGTNLPFFDGPLTLEPGESWELRHRIIVHEGDPWQAGIPERYDEYANPPLITVEGAP